MYKSALCEARTSESPGCKKRLPLDRASKAAGCTALVVCGNFPALTGPVGENGRRSFSAAASVAMRNRSHHSCQWRQSPSRPVEKQQYRLPSLLLWGEDTHRHTMPSAGDLMLPDCSARRVIQKIILVFQIQCIEKTAKILHNKIKSASWRVTLL